MSSRENTLPPSPITLSDKEELTDIPVLSDDDSDVEVDIEVLSETLRLKIFCNQIAHEISTNKQIVPLCGTGRIDMTTPESKIETVADDQTSEEMKEIIPNIIDEGVLQDQEPDVAGACVFKMSSRENTPLPSPLKLSKKELSIIPVLSDDDSNTEACIGALSAAICALIKSVEGLNIDEKAHEISTNTQVDPLCGTGRNNIVAIPECMIGTVANDQVSKEMEEIISKILDEGVLQDQKPEVSGVRNRREHRNSKAKQTQKKYEHAVPALLSLLETALKSHKCVKVEYNYTNMALRIKIDASLLLYTKNIVKLYYIDKGLDFVLDRFNEHKRFYIFVKSLHIFNCKIQYIADELKKDVDKVFKCHTTDYERTVGASKVQVSDIESICEKYIIISRRINKRVIEKSALYKDLTSSLKTSTISSESARLDALVQNANNYRESCLARIKKILPILSFFKENVERRIRDCNRISSNLCELAKATSNDAENKDEAKKLYKSSLDLIVDILRIKEEYLENCMHMVQKKEEMKKQSNALTFWGPKSKKDSMYNKDPNFIMTKTNSLIELNFEVFDSLRKIISDYQFIIFLADYIATPT